MQNKPQATMAGAEEEIQFETSEGVKVVNSFDDMGLKEDLVRGIYAYSKWKRI